ncbi:MAG: bifunctional DNA-formamidopyrimidine glycosylase/DNA-(apurinic or apyrimidinic site) lyase [Xanthomonadaceae bacterium]|nr:bifunctional DNA-formamidopyrimidine glycosylase/DNA-(apurinic or apyrimidinic site) lyase [Xanthomonadaceae bacterium]
MPELPEVETTRRGIAPYLVGSVVEQVVVRDRRLRWPVQPALVRGLTGATVSAVERRAKYLLLRTCAGTAIAHLGMSGSLRIVARDTPPFAHDHLDLLLSSGGVLRYSDPRRFGCWLWTARNPLAHPLLKDLGPEPLDDGFDGAYLFAKSRGRKATVKTFLMDGRIVVGVGNIYASESLWMAGIHPARAAGRIARTRYDRLAASVKEVLQYAIGEGGTTLRDYAQSDGSPGYFKLKLNVYDRAGKPCRRCETPIRMRVIGQRSSYYCPVCQR